MWEQGGQGQGQQERQMVHMLEKQEPGKWEQEQGMSMLGTLGHMSLEGQVRTQSELQRKKGKENKKILFANEKASHSEIETTQQTEEETTSCV